MSISVRELFHRQGIDNDVISIRHALANHPNDVRMSLVAASKYLVTPVTGDGFSRGCRRPEEVKISAKLFGVIKVHEKGLGHVLPSWVAVAGETRIRRIRGQQTNKIITTLRIDHDGETRTVEGVLVKSRITHTDFPFKPWHTYYDWNFFIKVDRQYRYLLSESNERDHGSEMSEVIECEWDTAFLPSWAWPQSGDRIWMMGRWIYDCGHPGENGHKTEIHPPKAVASFRTEAVTFPENSGPTQANNAILYIGEKGGYWQQPINEDFSFDLHLPPKPYSEATPLWKVTPKIVPLPVEPIVVPFPHENPRLLRVTIPLKDLSTYPQEYGAVISGGWSDPRQTEIAAIHRKRIVFTEFNFLGGGWSNSALYIGVNGYWNVIHLNFPVTLSLTSYPPKTLNHVVELDLHLDDRIQITVCGIMFRNMNRLIGDDTKLTWLSILDQRRAKTNAARIAKGFLSLGTELLESIENKPITHSSVVHAPGTIGTHSLKSPQNEYSLEYRIESRS